MVKIAVSATSIALLCVSSLAQADQHSEAEAQIEKLQQDNKILVDRLNDTMDFNKQRAAQLYALGQELDSEKNKSNALSTRLRNAIAVSKERAAQIDTLQPQLDSEKNKNNALNSRLSNAIAFSKERAAQIGTLQPQLDSEKSKNSALNSRLGNAIAFSKERAAQIGTLQPQLDSEKSKNSALNSRLSNSIAFSKERAAQISTLQPQLASEQNKSKALSNRLRNAISISKDRATQVASMEQAKSDWSATVSANLAAAVGGIQGTSVIANSDDSVNVQVGNNGLFRIGGTALSNEGSQLLSTIAQQLSALDSNITVVGHTDDVPVGNNSRFSSNEELSFARAVSTLQFLRNQGIPTEQLSAAGYGEGSPIAGNDTAEGRAQNRRVEIILRQQ